MTKVKLPNSPRVSIVYAKSSAGSPNAGTKLTTVGPSAVGISERVINVVLSTLAIVVSAASTPVPLTFSTLYPIESPVVSARVTSLVAVVENVRFAAPAVSGVADNVNCVALSIDAIVVA